jgi:hypothetical protein
VRNWSVLLVCGAAILAIEVLSALGLHFGLANAEAFQSLSYVLYLVAGIGGGRLEVSSRLRRAVWSGALTGGFTGFIGSIARQVMWWVLGTEPFGTPPRPGLGFLVMAAITVATAATLGLLGGIAGWGVRRAVEPGN